MLTQPRLVHFVASTPDLLAARMALRMVAIDRGPAVHASRRTSKGVLNWQISVRADGQRLFNVRRYRGFSLRCLIHK